MTLPSRVVMTIAAMTLISPFVYLFATLYLAKFSGNRDLPSETQRKIEMEIQARQAAISKTGQPAVFGILTETWICLCSTFGDYATVGRHEKLGIPGLLVSLSLLGLTLYCIWYPLRH